MNSKQFKKYFSFLMLFMLLGNIFLPKSASAAVMTHEKYDNKGWVSSNRLGFDVETDFIKLADGRIVYCLDERLDSPNGHDLEEMGRMGDGYYRILANGYPNKQPSELGVSSWQEAHFATQVAIWIFNTDLNYDDLVFKNTNVKNAVDKIRKDASENAETQDLSFEVTPDSIQAVAANEEYFKAGPFKINTNASGTFKPETINAPEGAYFTDASGNMKTEFEAKEEFYVNFKQVPTGSFNIKVTGNLNKMETIWYKSHDQGVQNALGVITTSHVPVKENIKVNWQKELKGSLELLKISEDGSKLVGATFELKDSDGNKVATLTTDENGIAKIGDLKLGTYTLVETNAPAGHVLDPTPIPVEVKDEAVVKVTAKNNLAKGEIEITKQDFDSKKPLANAEFKIFTKDGKEVATGVTNENGIVKFAELKNGEYYYVETKAPEGYILDSTPQKFIVDSQKKSLTFVNKQMKPLIKTTATNKENGSKEFDASKTATIQDKVEYKDLIVGKEYTMKGKLMDKSTGKPLLVNKKEVTAEKKFVPETKDGVVTLDFTFDASKLAGKEIVVFEDIFKEKQLVVSHA
ncbi:TQXA domain-containing protein, partial [Bacillus sp. AFS054943]|uniref:SpaA isopeptide-forming pilin-related protein n=1 Tax=Bacillus sp. AFS054943 TaxID=2033506 RepID=UPI000C03338E